MIVTLQIPPATQRKIQRGRKAAAKARQAIAAGLETAAVAGAEDVRRQLVMGELGLTMRNPGSGLAGSLMGWMVDPAAPTAAVGVPGDSPAAAYAGMLERGGTIYPRKSRFLAVPISEEAKQYASPRDMPGLVLIPRKGRPPLLVRTMSRRGGMTGMELHWVLVPSVTIPAFHWLSRGAETATTSMAAAFQARLAGYMGEW